MEQKNRMDIVNNGQIGSVSGPGRASTSASGAGTDTSFDHVQIPSNSNSSFLHHSLLQSQSQLQSSPPSSESSPGRSSSSTSKQKMTMEQAIELRRYDILHHNLSRQGHWNGNGNTISDNDKQQQQQQQYTNTYYHHHNNDHNDDDDDLCNDDDPNDPNEEILFHKKRVYMTGLEYAVFQNDWKMAILFYIHAADPSYNCFDGRIIRREDHEHLQSSVTEAETDLDLDMDMEEGHMGDEAQGQGQGQGLRQALIREQQPDNNDHDDTNDEHGSANAVHRRGRIRDTSSNDDDDNDDGAQSQSHSHAAFLLHLSKTHDNKHVPIAGFEGLYKLLHSIHKFMNLDRDDDDYDCNDNDDFCCGEEFEYNRVEFNKTLSSLWLMEQSYSDRKVVYKHDSSIIARTRKALFDIGSGDVWRREFCDMVYFLIQVMRRGGQGQGQVQGPGVYGYMNTHGHDHSDFCKYHCVQQYQVGNEYLDLTTGYHTDQMIASTTSVDPMSSEDSTNRIPNEICLYIMEYLVDDLLSHTIWKALKHVSDSAATTNRNHYI